MHRLTLWTLAAASALVLSLAVPALAAAPTKGGTYQQCNKNICAVSDIMVSKDGKKVTEFQAYDKCDPVPVMKWPSGKITPAGTFNITGSGKDVLKNTISWVIRGKFVSATKVTGTMKWSSKGAKGKCAGKAKKFTAVLAKGQG